MRDREGARRRRNLRRLFTSRQRAACFGRVGSLLEGGAELAQIEFDSVSKVYSDGTQAVYDLDLMIEDGELMVLVGPSGCGKTTALRMVAGLEEISDGELRIGDRIVNDLTPKERNIAMVFQSYALYPHMTVEDNLAFSLKLHKMPKKEVGRQRAAKILQIEISKAQTRALSVVSASVAMGRATSREAGFGWTTPKPRPKPASGPPSQLQRLDVTTIASRTTRSRR